MVQKVELPRVGRPRAYDPEVALDQAMDAFWDAGYSGTSLDDLSKRTKMNRPSLYAAFGDKEALYLKTLESYRAGRRAVLTEALNSGIPLRQALRRVYYRMIDRFLSGEGGQRGCYLVGTAATEAVQNPKVREILAGSFVEVDDVFRDAFSAAQARGELGKEADPRALAMLSSAVVQTLSLRARAGQSRALLQEVADSALKLIFSGGQPRQRRQRQPTTGVHRRNTSR